ncbi:MAG: CDP-diacylglycerol--glycerol-3-phosphate 3-phosphatidyltransferase [Clostridia bacterium]|nr:CDP-diacylglycerol--glycerol-3-phosphate 3-phosphatidyltransferase [Clostridia bacterium]
MNLPNKLTVIRMILAPIFLLLMTLSFEWHWFCALVVFVVASITDLLDGQIARKRGIVTNFGKFLDPIADKILTTSAFLGIMATDLECYKGVAWITFIVLIREFTVASLRMLCASEGTVVAADMWGKVKTVFQMIAIIMVLAFEWFKADVFPLFSFLDGLTWINTVMDVTANVFLWLSALLTIISGINYLVVNRKVIDYRK